MIVTYSQASQSALGAVTPASKIQIAAAPSSGSLQLLALQIAYSSGGACYVQLHDALAASSLTSATMVLPFGFPLDGSTNIVQLISWALDEAPLYFKTAVTLAASSTQNTYTAASSLFVAKGSWA